MQAISWCQHARLRFYGSGRPFVLFKTQLLSNGLVYMSLLASNKLERTDKATVTYWSVRSSLPSRALFNRVRSLLLSSLSSSFSVANVGSDILVLGLSSRVLDLLWLGLWSFEHAQIIGKEVWHNREHVLFLRACSVSQTGHTDRRTDELPPNDQMWGSLTLAPN